MRVGIESMASGCQPIRKRDDISFAQNNNSNITWSGSANVAQGCCSGTDKNAAAFKSAANAPNNQELSIGQKYELAKKIIAAQNIMIDSLQKHKATALPASNLLNLKA